MIYLLVGMILFIIAVSATLQCYNYARLRRERLATEAGRAQLRAQIDSLKTLRYCSDHNSKCRSRKDCKKCLIVTDKVSSDCAICLSDFLDGEQIRSLPCNHIFHADCADKWLEKEEAPGADRKCPMCRAVVISVRGNNESHHRQLWRARVTAEPEEPATHSHGAPQKKGASERASARAARAPWGR